MRRLARRTRAAPRAMLIARPRTAAGRGATRRGLDDASSWDALEDLHTMAEILREVVLEDRPEVLADQKTRWRLEDALERGKARERARGRPFSRRMGERATPER